MRADLKQYMGRMRSHKRRKRSNFGGVGEHIPNFDVVFIRVANITRWCIFIYRYDALGKITKFVI